MNYIIKILFLILLSANLSAQQVITSTVDSRTIEYSYDEKGRLIKNFSLDEKVNIDSLKQYVEGEWLITEYESWEKEKVDSLPKIIKFEKDNLSLISGFLFGNSEQLKGSFKILPNDAEGAEILIENILSEPKSYEKIKMYVLHSQKDIIFITIMTFTDYGNTYMGPYKLKRIN